MKFLASTLQHEVLAALWGTEHDSPYHSGQRLLPSTKNTGDFTVGAISEDLGDLPHFVFFFFIRRDVKTTYPHSPNPSKPKLLLGSQVCSGDRLLHADVSVLNVLRCLEILQATSRSIRGTHTFQLAKLLESESPIPRRAMDTPMEWGKLCHGVNTLFPWDIQLRTNKIQQYDSCVCVKIYENMGYNMVHPKENGIWMRRVMINHWTGFWATSWYFIFKQPENANGF